MFRVFGNRMLKRILDMCERKRKKEEDDKMHTMRSFVK